MLEKDKFNLPELEEQVLKFWKENQIFPKTTAARKRGKPFRFFEGPPTANGRPGTHHILVRAFKDIILRYKTMRGHSILRRAGWDTHGLPVEIEVEKELGLRNKQDIERYGIAQFNEKARASVWRYRTEWENFTERIGFWLDRENAYVTSDSSYIESLFWIFKEVWKKKLLYEGHKIIPWCTRCGTALSSHELAQGYKEVTDTSVYVKFKLKPGQKIGNWKTTDNTYILSWTTTPWTLPGNVALAVGKNISYVVRSQNGEYAVVAHDSSLKEVLGEVVVTVKGKDLIELEYEPLFDIPSLRSEKSHRVYAADFVTTEDGTGVVHTAVMYGEDDYELGVKIGLPQKHTVTEEGKFTDEVKDLAGRFVKAKLTETTIIEYLQSKNLLLKTEQYTHEYPHCWRCGTALIYYARNSWFIRMSELKSQLIAENARVNWIPSHVREGRFGEWLKELKDWAISRNRYWGTPLPIWKGEICVHTFVAGSFEDLEKHALPQAEFFLIRHGEAEHNTKNQMAGDDERPSLLTAKGKTQAKKAGADLKKKKIDLIISSPFARAKETAEIVSEATGAEIVYDERIREINVGVFNRAPVDDYHAFFNSFEERFTKTPEGGETLIDLARRVTSFMKDVRAQYAGKRIAVVSHGDPLWVLSAILDGMNLTAEIKEAEYILPGKWISRTVMNLPYNETGTIDPHRPFIDEIVLQCPDCGKTMRRIPDVADVWFDSGAMPFASWHYPFEHKGMVDGKKQFPADYITEAVDQTRGWFYTLLAVSTLLGKKEPYKNVISLGHILDKHGAKMSKSKGNVIDPWQLIGTHGVDAVRWYFFTLNDPGEPKRFNEDDLKTVFRKVFLITYNSFAFSKMYEHEKHNPLPALDQWILARLNEVGLTVSKKLDVYDVYSAAKALETFLDDLSRWYIRRSRKNVSPKTLQTVLVTLSKYMAPFAPFFSEGLYQAVATKKEKTGSHSVHIALWPKITMSVSDKKMIQAMEEVRRLANLALAEREKLGIKIRQPLSTLSIVTKILSVKDSALLAILADEVNVKHIVFSKDQGADTVLDATITPELRAEGLMRELSRMIQKLRQDAGYDIKDTVMITIAASVLLQEQIEKNKDTLLRMVGAKEMDFAAASWMETRPFDAKQETKLDQETIVVGIRRAK
ncbi:MAG: class I tRNA ligase family protein [Patescibacteria group bacterium]